MSNNVEASKWQITMHLRWYWTGAYGDRKLQQAWQNGLGETEWRDVPLAIEATAKPQARSKS